MALKDQPYFPLYVHDIMTDEKLNECSAATHGIYIKGIMCLMHKSEPYGKILLRQKYKQDGGDLQSKCESLGLQLVKHLPYIPEEIALAIEELVREGVCHFEGEYLVQKRMVKDNEISLLRARAGKRGAAKKKENSDFANTKYEANTKANYIANSENEIDNENESIIDNNEGGMGETSATIISEFGLLKEELANSTTWKESVCRAMHGYGFEMDMTAVQTWLDKFLLLMKPKGELDKALGQIKSHFVSWIKIELQNGRKSSTSTSTQPVSTTAERQDFS